MSVVAAPGLLAGRFAVEGEVGRGAVGIVYRARDQATGELVALKVIAAQGADETEVERFQREGQLLASLAHPGIVRVVACGRLDEGQPFIAMEWLDGEDVAARQQRRPLSLAESLDVAAQIAQALACAHAAGIVHRDVKPSNIILSPREPAPGAPLRATLVDFGVAAATDARLTRTGDIVGTPAYMAPEQARGDATVDARADIYALGATLFEMISGRPPHVGPTPVAVLARLVTTAAPRLGEVYPHAPLALDELVGSMLATQPADRPRAASDVANELATIARDLGTAPVSGARVTQLAWTPGESLPPPSSPALSGPGRVVSGTRLITSILAVHVPKGAARARLLAQLRARGAEATELGGDAIVAHLGVHESLGDEAMRALDLGLRLAGAQAAVGIATGRTRIDRTKPIGEVVDRAAALARDAAAGTVLADTTTSELSRGRFELQMRPDGAAQVTASMAGRREAHGGAPFVGREADLSQVLAAFERCADDETPVIVTITGAPGIGKTRLRREAIARIASHPVTPQVCVVTCESFARGHALGLMADVVRSVTGVSKGASLDEATATLRDAFGEARSGDGARVALVASLLTNEIAPEQRDVQGARDALWIAVTDLLLDQAKDHPTALAIEDVQWADAESLAWIDHLLARGVGRRLFVMATARPALWRDDPQRFTGRDHVRIELRPLAKRTVRAIAKSILGERALASDGDSIVDTIAGQAGGSPLFAEELARLAAQGRDASKAPTIEAAIQVHLDALDDDVRDAAARLAVFGQHGWDGGLAAVGVEHAEAALRALAAAEVVVEQAESRFKDTREVAFKHALTREVAYSSLSDDALKTFHAAAGRWLAGMGEDDATVARHLELGGDLTSASHFMERAARRALAATALSEAVSLAERALAFADDRPTQFARALLLDEAWNRLDARAAERATAISALREAIYDEASELRAEGARVRYDDACGGGPSTSADLEAVRARAKSLGLFDEEARCAAALAARYAFAGEHEDAAAVAEDLLELARAHDLPGAAVDAWQTLAVVRQASGDVSAALDARKSAADAAATAGLRTREATLTINVGFALTTMGAREESREAIEAGIALAETVGSPGVVRHGQMNLLGWTATFGSEPSLDRLLEAPRSLAGAALDGGWLPQDRATLGVLFYRGMELLRSDKATDADRARTLLRMAMNGYMQTGMLDVVPVAQALVSESERRCGQAERAYELARDAADGLEQGALSLLNEAPIFLALHDACVALGRDDEAREAVRRGIPWLERRAAGLRNPAYVRAFLTNLPANAGLVAAARVHHVASAVLDAALA